METERIQALIRTFLKQLSIPHTSITVTGSDEHLVFTIQTEEAGALIGQNGETLAALRFLIRRIAERESGMSAPLRFTVDVNGYEAQRMEKLKHDVLKQAERVRLFKHDVELPPMSSYERRIVHDVFANTPDIHTTSSGEGHFRHVVLVYRSK